MINQQINDDYGEHDQLRPTPSHNRYLKSSNSTNNLHQSVKHSGYLYLKSKKDLRKWQRKFFIWNGETLTYQDTLGDPIKWSINLNQIVSVRVKARNPQTSRSSISKLFTHCEVSSTETVEIRLIDESVVEIAGKTSEENQVWVDVLNRAVNVEWLRAFRECIVPGNRHRDAHVFFSASDSESEDGVIIDGADETSVSEQSVNSKIGKYIPLKKPGFPPPMLSDLRIVPGLQTNLQKSKTIHHRRQTSQEETLKKSSSVGMMYLVDNTASVPNTPLSARYDDAAYYQFKIASGNQKRIQHVASPTSAVTPLSIKSADTSNADTLLSYSPAVETATSHNKRTRRILADTPLTLEIKSTTDETHKEPTRIISSIQTEPCADTSNADTLLSYSPSVETATSPNKRTLRILADTPLTLEIKSTTDETHKEPTRITSSIQTEPILSETTAIQTAPVGPSRIGGRTPDEIRHLSRLDELMKNLSERHSIDLFIDCYQYPDSELPRSRYLAKKSNLSHPPRETLPPAPILERKTLSLPASPSTVKIQKPNISITATPPKISTTLPPHPVRPVSYHTDFLTNLCDKLVIQIKAFQNYQLRQKIENGSIILYELSQIIIRAISIHIMLVDSGKVPLDDPNTPDSPTSATKYRCLKDFKTALRLISLHTYNFSLCTNEKKIQNSPSWSVIRRLAVISLSIKHHKALLDKLEKIEWATKTASSVIDQELKERHAFTPMDIVDGIERLKESFQMVRETFGDVCEKLPSAISEYEK